MSDGDWVCKARLFIIPLVAVISTVLMLALQEEHDIYISIVTMLMLLLVLCDCVCGCRLAGAHSMKPSCPAVGLTGG